MINILPFYVPVSVFKVKNWEEKRKILEKSLSDIRKIDDKDEFILTDFHDYDGDKINATEVFKDELQDFCKVINAKSVTVRKSWIEDQERDMYHCVHNHGAVGFSAVCYLNFDSSVHRSLKFVAPFNNWRNGLQMDWSPEDEGIDVEESTIIFFPSFLLHYTYANNSDKRRTVASFNFDIELNDEPLKINV